MTVVNVVNVEWRKYCRGFAHGVTFEGSTCGLMDEPEICAWSRWCLGSENSLDSWVLPGSIGEWKANL